MKTIALISGGKDSVLSILAAYRHGHVPVVLLNFEPEQAATGDGETHEVDSYMFQTVGHEVVDAIADCFGLPIRRFRVSRGQSKDLSLRYTSGPAAADDGDEVESLHKALAAVKGEFPEVGGVTSGAILSNYQRYRVEEVCGRLGLQSLAFLWLRRPHEILDMAAAMRVRAVLVKTASVGLQPRSLVGKTLEEARPVLETMARLYGSHLAGEGGEYETIVLDCPMFEHFHLLLESVRVVMVDDNEYAPCGYGVISVSKTAKSPEAQVSDARVLESLRAGSVSFPSDRMRWLPSERLCSVEALLPGAVAMCADTAARLRRCPPPFSSITSGVRVVSVEVPLGASRSSGALTDEIVRAVEGVLRDDLDCEETTLFCVACAPVGEWESVLAAWKAVFITTTPPGRTIVPPQPSACDLTEPLRLDFLMVRAATAPDVLYCRSRSHWAAGSKETVAQAVKITASGADVDSDNSDGSEVTPSCVSYIRSSAVGGVHPVTWELVSGRDASVSELLGDGISDDDRTLASQFAYAFANSMAYLDFFGCDLDDIVAAYFLVNAPAIVEKIPCLWQWCAARPLPGDLSHFHITVVDDLPSGGVVEIMLEAVTRAA